MMGGGFMPWRRLIAVWLPVVVLCLVSLGLYVWQGSLGREVKLQEKIDELSLSIEKLELARNDAHENRTGVAELDTELEHIYRDIFGNLDSRLVPILRAVESAARTANMLPEKFSYRATENRSIECVRFGIKFSVNGSYQQVRTMLGALQESAEFFIVEGLTLSGEKDATSHDLAISLSVVTILSEVDNKQLEQLKAEVQ